MKQKHLTSDERVTIEKLLDMNCSFKWIGGETGKDCTTISKEVRTNSVTKNIGTYGRGFNNCINRYQCDYENSACPSCANPRIKKCSLCKYNCRSHCKNFIEEKCPKLDKPPYVCNACDYKNKCTLTKQFYRALRSQ